MGSPVAIVLAVVCGTMAPRVADAQAVSPAERDALIRMRTDRGGRADEVEALLRMADEAGAKNLPVAPLTNKIREGLAKGADPRRIGLVVAQMATNLESADRLMQELAPTVSSAGREPSVTLLAESLGGGVTVDEVRELRKQTQVAGRPAISPDALASGARGLAFIKDARLPVAEATAVMAEAARQGYRAHEVLDLAREIKRRERDYQAGRANLRALRDAIARGERPEQLFRDTRPEAAERPAATRPEPVERPATPERPERPQRPERPEVPERTGTGRTR